MPEGVMIRNGWRRDCEDAAESILMGSHTVQICMGAALQATR